MTLDQGLVLAGVLVAAIVGWAPLHYSIRKDARERARQHDDAIRQAVQDATAPLVADRDYWRGKADELERELRERGGGRRRD